MNQEQAFKLIEQALNVANQKGAFNLGEAQIVATALGTVRDALGLTPELPQPEVESKDDPTPVPQDEQEG